MRNAQQFSCDYDKYLSSILDLLRTKYKNVSVNRHQYLCVFHIDGKLSKVKHETLKESMLKNKLPKTITDLIK